MASWNAVPDYIRGRNLSEYPEEIVLANVGDVANRSRDLLSLADHGSSDVYDYVTAFPGNHSNGAVYASSTSSGSATSSSADPDPWAMLYGDWSNVSQSWAAHNWSSFYERSDWLAPRNETVDGRDLAAAIVKGVFLGALVMMTICGNVLVLLAVFINAHLRSTTHYFIANLAVADLLLGTTVLPFSASLEVIDRWVFGQLFCDIWAAVDVLCCTASIMGLCVISIDRYIGVTRPLQHSSIMTERRASLVIVLVWLLSVAISVAPLLGWKEPPPDNPSVCEVTKQLGYVLFSVSGSFYIPLAIILVVYFRVYREALNQSRFLRTGVKTSRAAAGPTACRGRDVTLRIHTGGAPGRRQEHAYRSAPSTERGGDESCRRRQVAQPIKMTLAGKIAKFKREKKAAKTLGIVVGVFILCWFPFFFVLPLEALCSSCYVPEWLFKVIFWLGYCNSMMNPIIYALSSREFKRAFIRILRCQWRRRPRCFLAELYRPRPIPSGTESTNSTAHGAFRGTASDGGAGRRLLPGFGRRVRRFRNRKWTSYDDRRRPAGGATCPDRATAAILYTSRVTCQRRRFCDDSPMTSLRLLHDRRKETSDTLVISDDSSGAIHEESDAENEDNACLSSSGPSNPPGKTSVQSVAIDEHQIQNETEALQPDVHRSVTTPKLQQPRVPNFRSNSYPGTIPEIIIGEHRQSEDKTSEVTCSQGQDTDPDGVMWL